MSFDLDRRVLALLAPCLSHSRYSLRSPRELNPEQYTWLGINGTATNYGVAIAPQTGDPPVPVDEIVYPKWLEDLKKSDGPTFITATAGADDGGATPGKGTSSASMTGIIGGVLAFIVSAVSL